MLTTKRMFRNKDKYNSRHTRRKNGVFDINFFDIIFKPDQPKAKTHQASAKRRAKARRKNRMFGLEYPATKAKTARAVDYLKENIGDRLGGRIADLQIKSKFIKTKDGKPQSIARIAVTGDLKVDTDTGRILNPENFLEPKESDGE